MNFMIRDWESHPTAASGAILADGEIWTVLCTVRAPA
jgi:hypothetical protein